MVHKGPLGLELTGYKREEWLGQGALGLQLRGKRWEEGILGLELSGYRWEERGWNPRLHV